MTLHLTFLDGTYVKVKYVEAVRLVSRHEVESNTYDNTAVRHRNVQQFAATYDADTALKQEE